MISTPLRRDRGRGRASACGNLGRPLHAHLVQGVPQPLGIGQLRLEDGTLVMGFIAEPAATEGSLEITHFGGWRNYLASKSK